jgi:hypothetical protein
MLLGIRLLVSSEAFSHCSHQLIGYKFTTARVCYACISIKKSFARFYQEIKAISRVSSKHKYQQSKRILLLPQEG